MNVVPLLTAVTGAGEAALVAGLEQEPGVRVVRRCADAADLLATAEAGLAGVAVVSAGLRGLDADLIDRLISGGCALVILAEAAEQASADMLAAHVPVHSLPASSSAEQVARAALEAAAPATLAPGGRGRHALAAGGSEDLVEPARTGSDSGVGLGDPRAALAQPQPLAAPPRDQGQVHQSASRGAPGRVVAIWGPTGAPGRTAIAIALAAEFAATAPTLLVDADTYGASVGQCLGLLDEAPGLAAAAHDADRGRLDLARLSRHALVVSGELRVLTGVLSADRWPELRAGALSAVLERARELVEWVVVDTGFCLEQDEEMVFDTAAPRRNGATVASLAAADVVVAVGGADPVGLQRLVRGLQELKNVVGSPQVVVANRVRASAVGRAPGRRIREALQRYAGIDDPVMVPYDREAFDAAGLVGRTLAEQGGQTPVTQAISHLAGRIRLDRDEAGGNGGQMGAADMLATVDG